MARIVRRALLLWSAWALLGCREEKARDPSLVQWQSPIHVKAPPTMAIQAPYFGERGPRPASQVDRGDLLFWNRWHDESISPDDFVRLTGYSVTNAMGGSNGYLDWILKPEVGIYEGAQNQHFVHDNPECLLHRYDVFGLPLLVYENPQYITVRVAAPPLAGETREAFVSRVMGALLRSKVTWSFFPSPAPDESLRFSTNSSFTPEMRRDAIGVSGAIVPGGLYFTTFRALMFDYSDPRPRGAHRLLDDDLRKVWADAHGVEFHPKDAPRQPGRNAPF